MQKYVFTNLVGSFVVNEKGKIIDKSLFKRLEDFKKKDVVEKKLMKKHDASLADKEVIKNVLSQFKQAHHLRELYKRNLELSKEKIRSSVNEDNLICQAINSVLELERMLNMLTKRLREWHALYNPELTVGNNEKFVELVLTKEKKSKDSMGADLSEENLKGIFTLAKAIDDLYKKKDQTTNYIEHLMSKYCPNLKELAGVTIGAKLLAHTGSLKKLVMMPASTIQILGAEKALFRHLRSGARPPKHGLIFQHQFISGAKRKEQGKRARALADKISIAVKVDFFKGKFIAKELKKDLDKRFS